jgi:hypothetical protein
MLHNEELALMQVTWFCYDSAVYEAEMWVYWAFD